MILRMVSIPLASVAERLFSISEMVDLFNPAAAANCCWFIPASALAARNWSRSSTYFDFPRQNRLFPRDR